jgi:DNA excision repair protein ERCC-3
MFSMGDGNLKKRKQRARTMIESCQEREWGLMILDEVHLAPAKIFKKIANKMRCHIKLGLTVWTAGEEEEGEGGGGRKGGEGGGATR